MDDNLIGKLNKMLKKRNTEVYGIGGLEAWEDEKSYRISNNDMIYDFDAVLVTGSKKVALRINGNVKRWDVKDKNIISDIMNCIESHIGWLYV